MVPILQLNQQLKLLLDFLSPINPSLLYHMRQHKELAAPRMLEHLRMVKTRQKVFKHIQLAQFPTRKQRIKLQLLLQGINKHKLGHQELQFLLSHFHRAHPPEIFLLVQSQANRLPLTIANHDPLQSVHKPNFNNIGYPSLPFQGTQTGDRGFCPSDKILCLQQGCEGLVAVFVHIEHKGLLIFANKNNPVDIILNKANVFELLRLDHDKLIKHMHLVRTIVPVLYDVKGLQNREIGVEGTLRKTQRQNVQGVLLVLTDVEVLVNRIGQGLQLFIDGVIELLK